MSELKDLFEIKKKNKKKQEVRKRGKDRVYAPGASSGAQGAGANEPQPYGRLCGRLP